MRDYWQSRAGEPSIVSAVLARLAASGEQAAERLAERTIVEPVTAPIARPVPEAGPLLITSSSEVHGSVLADTIVQRNCTLHVRGNLLGSLTIEPGANVIVEGSVDGKITNRGGRLLVHNKGLAACVTLEGPPEAEAAGILKINLTNLAANYERLSKRTDAECAAILKADAYGCGIGPIAAALSKSGCNTFFVSDLAEAKKVRAVAPRVVIYVLGGFYSGTGPTFAEIDARPVINSAIELAEWDMFVASQASSQGWAGGCALNVDSGDGGLGLSIEEAAAFAPRVQSLKHGIALLLSRLDKPGGANDPAYERQLGVFRDLRRLYDGVPASLAGSCGIFSALRRISIWCAPAARSTASIPRLVLPIRCCRSSSLPRASCRSANLRQGNRFRRECQSARVPLWRSGGCKLPSFRSAMPTVIRGLRRDPQNNCMS